MIRGRCECGVVTYEIDGVIDELTHCHCSQCRRLHGAAFASFAQVPRAGFRYLSGAADVKIYPSSKGTDRHFCGHCGSQILADAKVDSGALYVTMGTVDGNPKYSVSYHEYVGFKAPWFEIGDGLAQYDGAVDE